MDETSHTGRLSCQIGKELLAISQGMSKSRLKKLAGGNWHNKGRDTMETEADPKIRAFSGIAASQFAMTMSFVTIITMTC
jgi:hypothetical protein